MFPYPMPCAENLPPRRPDIPKETTIEEPTLVSYFDNYYHKKEWQWFKYKYKKKKKLSLHPSPQFA